MIEGVDPSGASLLATIHAAAFDAAWTEAEIGKLMNNPTVFVLIARNPAPQGFVMAWAAGGDSEILTLAVVPDARRRGIGASLVTAAGVAALVRGASTMHLEVAETNQAARALYAKLGYVEAGRRGAYYASAQGAVDALVLRRDLPRPLV
ncbi:MAG: GNAT family N-acetyltransferase [Hyphomonadaceae bacterium]|nr:GNAT family N-acetyltransferase [Hyphomonadaceae bacterium]